MPTHVEENAVKRLTARFYTNREPGTMLQVGTDGDGQRGVLGVDGAGDGFSWRRPDGIGLGGPNFCNDNRDERGRGGRGIEPEAFDGNVGRKFKAGTEAEYGLCIPGLAWPVCAEIPWNCIAGDKALPTLLQIDDEGRVVKRAIVRCGGAGFEGERVVAFFDGVGQFETVLKEAQIAQGRRGVGKDRGVEQDAGLSGGRAGGRRNGSLPMEAAGGQAGRREQKRENAEGKPHALDAIVSPLNRCP